MSSDNVYSAWRRNGLKGSKNQPLTTYRTHDELFPATLKPKDVVSKIHIISLYYRKIAMLIGTYPVPLRTKESRVQTPRPRS